jgi:hypothetical protein
LVQVTRTFRFAHASTVPAEPESVNLERSSRVCKLTHHQPRPLRCKPAPFPARPPCNRGATNLDAQSQVGGPASGVSLIVRGDHFLRRPTTASNIVTQTIPIA